MSALSLRMSEASKNRHFLCDGFPKPHHDQDRTHRSLLFGSSPSSSTRAGSPYHSSKVSPMPSPIVLPPRDPTTSTTPPQTTSSTPPSSSKTNAFFGSAWATRIPTPTPPAPVQRSNSLHPNSSHSRSSTKYGNLTSEGSRDFAPRSYAVSDSHAPSRSQTADFFIGSIPSTPTPPPSIRPITPSPKRAPGSLPTPSPSPAKPSTTPPEPNSARLNVPSFFPGRVSGDTKGRSTDEDIILGFPDTLNDPLSRLPSLHRPTTGLAINHPSTSHNELSIDNGVDGSVLSRSSSRSSVSGFRRDFYIGSSGSGRSALSGYQAPKPGPYERESDRDGTPWVNPRVGAGPIETRVHEGTAIHMSPVRAEFHASGNEYFQDNQQPAGITAQPSPPCTMKLAQHHFAHSGSTSAVRRETRRSSIEGAPLEHGATIGDEVPFELLKPLGQGAFSSVWLARDVEDRLLPPLARSASKKQRQKRRKSASMAKKLEEYVRGIKPSVKVDGSGPGVLDEMDGKGACWPESPEASRSNSMTSKEPRYKPGRLVAVKMMDRSLCDTNDRTRISFVREVEVLRVRYCIQPLLSHTLIPFA